MYLIVNALQGAPAAGATFTKDRPDTIVRFVGASPAPRLRQAGARPVTANESLRPNIFSKNYKSIIKKAASKKKSINYY